MATTTIGDAVSKDQETSSHGFYFFTMQCFYCHKLLPYLAFILSYLILFVCLDELVLEAMQVSKAKDESEWYYVCISIRFFHFALPFFLLRSRLLQSLRQSSVVQCSAVQGSPKPRPARTQMHTCHHHTYRKGKMLQIHKQRWAEQDNKIKYRLNNIKQNKMISAKGDLSPSTSPS